MTLESLNLSVLGAIHTAIALIAVAAGLVSFIRDREILSATRLGKAYVIATVITCLTGFGIYRNGGFGAPHVLGIVTLVVLGLVHLAEDGRFGKGSRYLATAGLTLTFFFHLIPGVAETATRLPVGAPWAESNESPQVLKLVGVLFLATLLGMAAQMAGIRRRAAT